MKTKRPADKFEQSGIHVARRNSPRRAAGSKRASRESASELSPVLVHSGAGLVRTPLPEASRPSEPVPIWLAALLASSCQAQRNGENHAVRWNWVSGRAVYTNAGRDAEHIQPWGVSLLGGHTLAICWMPGETAYTVEVYRQTGLCA